MHDNHSKLHNITAGEKSATDVILLELCTIWSGNFEVNEF